MDKKKPGGRVKKRQKPTPKNQEVDSKKPNTIKSSMRIRKGCKRKATEDMKDCTMKDMIKEILEFYETDTEPRKGSGKKRCPPPEFGYQPCGNSEVAFDNLPCQDMSLHLSRRGKSPGSRVKLDPPTSLLCQCPAENGDDQYHMRIPEKCDAHVLDHMRCNCSACMDCVCRWRQAIKDKFYQRASRSRSTSKKCRRSCPNVTPKTNLRHRSKPRPAQKPAMLRKALQRRRTRSRSGGRPPSPKIEWFRNYPGKECVLCDKCGLALAGGDHCPSSLPHPDCCCSNNRPGRDNSTKEDPVGENPLRENTGDVRRERWRSSLKPTPLHVTASELLQDTRDLPTAADIFERVAMDGTHKESRLPDRGRSRRCRFVPARRGEESPNKDLCPPEKGGSRQQYHCTTANNNTPAGPLAKDKIPTRSRLTRPEDRYSGCLTTLRDLAQKMDHRPYELSNENGVASDRDPMSSLSNGPLCADELADYRGWRNRHSYTPGKLTGKTPKTQATEQARGYTKTPATEQTRGYRGTDNRYSDVQSSWSGRPSTLSTGDFYRDTLVSDMYNNLTDMSENKSKNGSTAAFRRDGNDRGNRVQSDHRSMPQRNGGLEKTSSYFESCGTEITGSSDFVEVPRSSSNFYNNTENLYNDTDFTSSPFEHQKHFQDMYGLVSDKDFSVGSLRSKESKDSEFWVRRSNSNSGHKTQTPIVIPKVDDNLGISPIRARNARNMKENSRPQFGFDKTHHIMTHHSSSSHPSTATSHTQQSSTSNYSTARSQTQYSAITQKCAPTSQTKHSTTSKSSGATSQTKHSTTSQTSDQYLSSNVGTGSSQTDSLPCRDRPSKTFNNQVSHAMTRQEHHRPSRYEGASQFRQCRKGARVNDSGPTAFMEDMTRSNVVGSMNPRGVFSSSHSQSRSPSRMPHTKATHLMTDEDGYPTSSSRTSGTPSTLESYKFRHYSPSHNLNTQMAQFSKNYRSHSYSPIRGHTNNIHRPLDLKSPPPSSLQPSRRMSTSPTKTYRTRHSSPSWYQKKEVPLSTKYQPSKPHPQHKHCSPEKQNLAHHYRQNNNSSPPRGRNGGRQRHNVRFQSPCPSPPPRDSKEDTIIRPAHPGARQRDTYSRNNNSDQGQFRPSMEVMTSKPPRTDQEWLDKHLDLMTQCGKERHRAAKERLQRIASRSEGLRGSMDALHADVDDIEEKMDRVSQLQKHFLDLSEKACFVAKHPGCEAERERQDRREQARQTRQRSRESRSRRRVTCVRPRSTSRHRSTSGERGTTRARSTSRARGTSRARSTSRRRSTSRARGISYGRRLTYNGEADSES